MKKIILILTIVAALMAFTACGGSKDNAATPSNGDQTQTTQITKAPADTKQSEPVKQDDPTPVPDEPTPAPTDEPTPEPTDEPAPPAVDHQVDALGNSSDVYDIDKTDMIANIVAVNDYGEYRVVSFDFKQQYELMYNELAGKRVGDNVYLNGKTTTITKIYSEDKFFDFTVEHDSYEDGCRILVEPENPEEFFTAEDIANGEKDFGFVLYTEDGTFRACIDWWWDCCSPMCYTVLNHVNLVVTENTRVHCSDYPYDEYGDDFTVSGIEYLDMRDNEDLQNEREIFINKNAGMYITEVLDSTGRSTGEVESICEIYTPESLMN